MAKPRFARTFLTSGTRASFITATLAAAAMAAPASAATFISGTVGAGTDAYMAAGSPTNDPHQASITISSAPVGMSVSTSSSISTPANGSVSTYANNSASWASANAGSVTMSWGWNFNPLNTQSYVVTDTVRAWTYTFSTGNVAERFAANWSTLVSVGQGSSFGLNGFYGDGGLPNPVSEADNGSGSFIVNLLPNSTYTFQLYNQGNVAAFTTALQADKTATLNWTISPIAGVPEPAAWALMILGFGVVGGAMRRRKAAAAYA